MSATAELTRETIESVDAARQVDDILGMPDQLRDALWRVESANLEPDDAPGGLIVAGMGGSAVGGTLASVFHYLGASAFVSTAPTVLVAAVIYRLGFARDLLLAVGVLCISALCLVIYSAIEVQSQPAH